MLVNRLKSALIATAGAGALFLGLASPASASPLILNPSAQNGNAACGIGVPCQISPLVGAFSLGSPSTASLNFTSDLMINSLPNAAPPPLGIGAREVGSFQIFLFSNAGSGIVTDYNIYGTFDISGVGGWVIPNLFALSSVTSSSITLSANPGGAGGAVGAPTFVQATQANNGLTSGNPQDFLLALAAVTGISGLTDAFISGVGSIPGNSTDLHALLGLAPTAGTTGSAGCPGLVDCGFWANVAPSGLNLSVSSTDSSTGTEITVYETGAGAFDIPAGDVCPAAGLTATGSCTVIRTAYSTSGANGSLTFDVVATPEPGTLSLFGMGLLGLGFMLRRRNESASKAA